MGFFLFPMPYLTAAIGAYTPPAPPAAFSFPLLYMGY